MGKYVVFCHDGVESQIEREFDSMADACAFAADLLSVCDEVVNPSDNDRLTWIEIYEGDMVEFDEDGEAVGIKDPVWHSRAVYVSDVF